MELMSKFSKMTGFISFLIGLVLLAILNISLLTQKGTMDGLLNPIIYFSLISFVLGVVGLFAFKRFRLFAIWGIGISAFCLIFLVLMFGLSWSINPRP
ncbi:hypothetical protein NV379_11705 [Paenibacillus sp. N1-5-1-14]|uniref:hypothetical protein n=1 Tax=Paenibacillus radicibacter TaxID=2972488 RepID=UPI002158E0B8|nr:hypothetical protein [Paenibacillus radicibacter]MCR8643318.1 hypothetical protein [Paenibacillus radicibacter]